MEFLFWTDIIKVDSCTVPVCQVSSLVKSQKDILLTFLKIIVSGLNFFVNFKKANHSGENDFRLKT